MKIALRNIKRHKGYSFINIFGLAAGIACCILIFLWVQDEFSYDKFHDNGDNLYLVGTHQRLGSRTATSSGTPPALGPAFKQEYPEIVNSARFCNGPHALIFAYGEKRFRELTEAVVDLSNTFTLWLEWKWLGMGRKRPGYRSHGQIFLLRL